MWAGPGQGSAEWEWGLRAGAGLWAWPSDVCRELDPGRERGAEATHCSHEVLQSPAEPHGAAEAHLQVLQGGAEGSWSPGEAPFRGPRLLGPSPALLASARPPEASSALLPTGERRGGGLPPSSLSSLSAHTCAHAPSPRLCMPRVPTGRHHQACTEWSHTLPPVSDRSPGAAAALSQLSQDADSACDWLPTVRPVKILIFVLPAPERGLVITPV